MVGNTKLTEFIFSDGESTLNTRTVFVGDDMFSQHIGS